MWWSLTLVLQPTNEPTKDNTLLFVYSKICFQPHQTWQHIQHERVVSSFFVLKPVSHTKFKRKTLYYTGYILKWKTKTNVDHTKLDYQRLDLILQKGFCSEQYTVMDHQSENQCKEGHSKRPRPQTFDPLKKTSNKTRRTVGVSETSNEQIDTTVCTII